MYTGTVEARPRRLVIYVTSAGRRPFRIWLESLKDETGRARVLARLERVEDGNLGDHKPVGGGVMELRVDYGPGYRVYCAQDGLITVVLLCGGSKGAQKRDISRAKDYWLDYQRRED